jgi:uncharacterized membrane protein YkoI
MISPKHTALCILLGFNLLLALPAHADEGDNVVVSGVRPVSAVVQRFHSEFDNATVLEVELEQEEGSGKRDAVYEVKAFTKRGAVLKVYYDARTLRRLQVKGRRERDDD